MDSFDHDTNILMLNQALCLVEMEFEYKRIKNDADFQPFIGELNKYSVNSSSTSDENFTTLNSLRNNFSRQSQNSSVNNSILTKYNLKLATSSRNNEVCFPFLKRKRATKPHRAKLRLIKEFKNLNRLNSLDSSELRHYKNKNKVIKCDYNQNKLKKRHEIKFKRLKKLKTRFNNRIFNISKTSNKHGNTISNNHDSKSNENKDSSETATHYDSNNNKIFKIKKIPRKIKQLPCEESNEVNEGKKNSEAKFKDRFDCLRKRFKALGNRFVLNKLNFTLINEGNSIYMMKLPRIFTTDVKICSNEKFFSSTLKNIFNYEVSEKKENVKVKHNRMIISSIINNNDFRNLLSERVIDLYNEYLRSQDYASDLDFLLQRNGEEYVVKFKKEVDFFMNHFQHLNK